MASTRSSSRTEPGLDSPGQAPPAGPGVPNTPRFAEDAPQRPRPTLPEPRRNPPPRRLGRLVLLALLLVLGGGVAGLMLAVELLGHLAGPPADRSGAEAPPPAAVSAPTGAPSPAPAPPGQDADRMQLNAELLALRHATVAEQARLESLARQRAEAEARLATLQRQPTPATEPTPAMPPSARPTAASRPRPEARAEGRVQVHFLAGSSTAQQAAEDAATMLRDAGVEGVELRPVPGVPGNRVVRYSRAEDAGLAARLAGRLGRGWAVQDNRAYAPGAGNRGLEVWLPDH